MSTRGKPCFNHCQGFVRAGPGRNGRPSHSGYCKVYSFVDGVWIGTIETAVKRCPYCQ
jgi:hypothetical protein